MVASLVNARERFARLEKAAAFPRRCEYCAQTFGRDDSVSVLERSGLLPLVIHTACLKRAGYATGKVIAALLIVLCANAHYIFAQDSPRPRPSRPIPPPSAVVSYTILVDRSAFPQAIHVMGVWQQPDGETSVYRHNAFIPSSGLGPGDHVITEVDVPALADLVPVEAPDCNGGCGPYCAQVFDLVTMWHECNCSLFPFRPLVPMRTSNAAEQFQVANQTRRLVVMLRDKATGGNLESKVHDLMFTWSDIGVFAAPTLRRRAVR